jgi:hypothetical protein
MTTGSFHPGRIDPFSLVFILAVIMFAAIIGKEVIAWLLMKLYEIFIQQNPLKL